jgi:hypothetical protein
LAFHENLQKFVSVHNGFMSATKALQKQEQNQKSKKKQELTFLTSEKEKG